MNKICNRCGKTLPIIKFNLHPNTADGHQNQCRPCRNEVQIQYRKERNGNIKTAIYEKTKKGFLVRCYRNMLSRVKGVTKKKNHLYLGLEILEKEIFYDWSLNNDSYQTLFKNWEKENYNRKFTPSIDRINSSMGYSIENIRWITFSENCSLGALNKVKNMRIVNGKIV